MSGDRTASRKESLRRTAQQAWPDGYMTAKIQKLEIQFQADNRQFEKKSDIFQGVSIHVNGYTQPPADELRRLVGIHGGGYMNYFVRGTNHYVICCNLSKAKKADWLKHAVKPEWIVDSITAGRRLAVADYYLEKKRTVFDYRQGVVEGASTATTCGTISDIVIGKDAEGPRPEMKKKDFVKKEEPRTASDVGFVEKFFAKSRLSFIATMKVKMREYLKSMTESPAHQLSGRESLRSMGSSQNESLESVYMHIDMDCFFASVAMRNRPELKLKPVAVCSNLKAKRKNQDPNLDLTDYRSWNWHDASTAEISCCNYAARQFGVHASMYLGQAQALCPDLVVLPYDFEGFEEVSKCLYDAVASLTLNIEAQSVDELFADVSDVIEDTRCTPEEIGQYLKSTILEKSSCTCTVGMGPNMLIARLATKKAKPDGFCYIGEGQVAEFMSDKKVSEIPGVGDSTEIKLRDLGVSTCVELQNVPLAELKELFGVNQAQKLIELAKGICTRTIKDALTTQRKNISVEINYGMRFKQISEVTNCLNELVDEVYKRLQNSNLAAEMLRLRILVRHPSAPEETMKYLGCGRCDQLAKSETFKIPIADKGMIAKSVHSLYGKLKPAIKDIRGLGITLSKLTSIRSIPKISNIESFLGPAISTDHLTASPGKSGTQPGPSFDQKRAENKAPIEIYILSSTDESGDEGCPMLIDEPHTITAVTSRKTTTPNKKLNKSRVTIKARKESKTRGQLDIRRVIEFGKEARGELVPAPLSTLHELSATENALPTMLEEAKPYKLEPSPAGDHATASFGPKKLFHLCSLLQEWVSGPLEPTEADISAWITTLQQVALIDPRSCTALLRSMIRQVRKGLPKGVNVWSRTCYTIRERVQSFVNTKMASGDISIQL